MFDFKFRNLVIDDILDLMSVDYSDIRNELQYTIENKLFKYLGCSEGNARFLIGIYDDILNTYVVTMLLVSIGKDRLICDFRSDICMSTKIESEMLEYFEKRCN